MSSTSFARVFSAAEVRGSAALAVTYLDQNALIELGRHARRPEFRQKLDEAVSAGGLTVVLSSWHLTETAHTAELSKALELAEFMDSLKPLWLFERRDIQRFDVEEHFYSFLRVPYQPRPRVSTRSAVVAALNGGTDSPRFDIPSPAFVKQWIQHPEQVAELEKTLQDNADALAALRVANKAGTLTDELRTRVDKMLVQASMPENTPPGVYPGRGLKVDYVQHVNVAEIPSLAIEVAISETEWSDEAAGLADRNTVIDKFHLISALPWVDEIVSSDKFFHAIYPVAQKTGHVKARLVDNADFLSRF